ncbi:hypothetical protein PC118_g20320 [Phytophthora cactorum]|uniref:DDE Tnp4 domain-containing protein n=2 Tax=Phytophthora cactorum TaxID=29920 RepID=A0A329R8V5_9STRA|nr:hypothetical protein PC115_g20135 [Phytophthora cactorum]KAG2964438.1 hypothetical protein PC118_g20320 [Phytophthora cactorum]KAG2976619.1 hypothetical protein PC119_g22128 [Phytophthora cactorum]KAG3058716.1 hypothetical protein PC122_g20599 [Phytophthora cactorum]RAW20286.1 hypothetical protein PC110_g23272 [Phytophthora cactorum]
MEGRRHDITMLRESKLADYMADHHDVFNGCIIYGDPAYGIQTFLVSGCKSARVSANEKKLNKMMSSVRESVEWKFGGLKTQFAFVDYKKSLKIRLSPVGKYVLVSMFLLNCHCCYYGGNQISEYFGVDPPSLDEYLNP